MTLRTSVAVVTLALGMFTSASAFAQGVPCHGGAPVAQPVVAQPVVGQPVYPTAPAVGTPVYTPVGATTVVAQPVYAPQPAYGRPMQQGFGARRALMQFTYALQARVAQAERQMQFGVSRGSVAPQAVQAFAAQRAQLDSALAQASQDGFLAPYEQNSLDQMTASLERLDERFRVPVAPVAYNNGYGRNIGYGHGFGRRWR